LGGHLPVDGHLQMVSKGPIGVPSAGSEGAVSKPPYDDRRACFETIGSALTIVALETGLRPRRLIEARCLLGPRQ
jgi:hypothetical protein